MSIKAKRRARAVVQVECDTCAGTAFPIPNWDQQLIVERKLTPLSHTVVQVEVDLGDFNSSTLLGAIQLIWSLRYPSDAWRQRRQYLQLINCSVADYTIEGVDTGDIISLPSMPVYKPLFLVDKTLRTLYNQYNGNIK